MALRDVTGAVDFAVLNGMTGADDAINEEVLGLFVQQAGLWSVMLDPKAEGGVALGEGSTLELRVKESPKTRRITVKKDGNTVTRTITEDGETRPMGKEDEAWLKEKLDAVKDAPVKVEGLSEGKDLKLEVRKEAKDGQKPKVFVYRSGAFPKGFKADSVWFHTGRVEGLDGKAFPHDLSDPEAARKWAEDLKKRLPNPKDIRIHIDRATRSARLHMPEMSHDIQKDGDREIHRFTVRRTDKAGQDPAAEASRVRQQIERLQKRLADLEKQAPKAAK